MAEKPENHTLRLLREMREEIQKNAAETAARFDRLEIELAAMRVDQGRMLSILEALHEGRQKALLA